MKTGRCCSILALAAGLCALALSTAGGAFAAAPGLVAGYGFEEDAGATAVDSSEARNNGTVSGPVRTAAGRFGRALSFDGVNDMVSAPYAEALDLERAMTLEAWVKPSELGGMWRTAVVKERPGDIDYALYANTNAGAPGG